MTTAQTHDEEPCSVCESHMRKTEGFFEVSQDVFFRKLKDDPRDIMPVVQGPFPYMSEWLTKSGHMWGLSVPTSRHGARKRYFVQKQ